MIHPMVPIDFKCATATLIQTIWFKRRTAVCWNCM